MVVHGITHTSTHASDRLRRWWHCRCAAALYILRCAPALLAPFGALTALMYVLLGSVLTIAGAGALVVSLRW